MNPENPKPSPETLARWTLEIGAWVDTAVGEAKSNYERAARNILDCAGGGNKTLFLGDLKLHSLPAVVWQQKQLRQLHLGGNLLTCLPDALGNLTALTHLTLGRNLLREIPGSIGELMQLEVLDLSFNHIWHLPRSVASLTKLRYCYLHSPIPVNDWRSLSGLPGKCLVTVWTTSDGSTLPPEQTELIQTATGNNGPLLLCSKGQKPHRGRD